MKSYTHDCRSLSALPLPAMCVGFAFDFSVCLLAHRWAERRYINIFMINTYVYIFWPAYMCRFGYDLCTGRGRRIALDFFLHVFPLFPSFAATQTYLLPLIKNAICQCGCGCASVCVRRCRHKYVCVLQVTVDTYRCISIHVSHRYY